MASTETLSPDETLRLVRDELDRRGIPVAVRLAIGRHRYSPSDFMRVGSTEFPSVKLPLREDPLLDIAVGKLSDDVQIALRDNMVLREAGRWLKSNGRQTMGIPRTPAWGLACHPYALALLDLHGPDGGWMHAPRIVGSRDVRAFELKHSTLSVDEMSASGQCATSEGYMPSRFAFSTDRHQGQAAGIWSTVNVGVVLPETVLAELPGRRLVDVVEMPPTTDRIAAAVGDVEITHVNSQPKTTILMLKPTEWICAAPLPRDVDPDCLSIPMPPR